LQLTTLVIPCSRSIDLLCAAFVLPQYIHAPVSGWRNRGSKLPQRAPGGVVGSKFKATSSLETFGLLVVPLLDFLEEEDEEEVEVVDEVENEVVDAVVLV
jgi:hypothetical protein